MSRSQGSSSLWFMFAILAGLFYLSINEPRRWEVIARSKPLKIQNAFRTRAPKAQPILTFEVKIADIPAPSEVPAVEVESSTLREPSYASQASEERVWTLATLRNAEAVIENPLRMASARSLEKNSESLITVPEASSPVPAVEAFESVPPSDQVAISETEEPALSEATEAAPEKETPESLVSETEILASLERRLDRLAHRASTSAWASETRQELRAFLNASGETREAHAATLSRLTSDAGGLAESAPLEVAVDLRRASHCIARRVSFWRLAELSPREPSIAAATARTSLANALNGVEPILNASSNRDAWRKFFLIDDLRWLQSGVIDAGKETDLAAAALARIEAGGYSEANQQFLSAPEFGKLIDALRPWAAQGLDRDEVLDCLNRFEIQGDSESAAKIADRARRLAWSNDPAALEAGRFLNEAYRNANLRVAVSANFLNRILPEQEPRVGFVNDRILGVVARGRQQTATDLSIKFTPDSHRLLASLHADGKVTSWTRSKSGPATIGNRSHSRFVLDKPFELNLKGVHAWPASSSATSVTQLRSLETDLDAIPIFGFLLQGIVRSQYSDKQPAARGEIQRRVSQQAESEMEKEAAHKVAKLNRKFRNRVLEPLDELRLAPTVVETQTTEERMVMRLRVAHASQLGGHTPRPAAPADAIFSMQLHQSLANNVVGRLELDGRTFTLAELKEHLVEKLNASLAKESERLPTSLLITFAERDPVTVKFEEDRVQVTIAIDELKRGRERWRNIVARAYYVPVVDGLDAHLMRDGIINVKGDMSTRGQIAVRGIFGTIFPSERPVKLIPDELIAKPNLKDQEVRQLTFDDGWMGIAIGPRDRDRFVRRGAPAAK